MNYSLAPMEGITGHTFRRVHAECFGALDCYYTPFLAPPRVGNSFGGKAFKEIDPLNNEGLNVIPQLLTKNADEFVWAARELAELGYAEVNLNLGCPSGTVVSKGKGSGFLRNLDELEVFLRDVCDRSPLPVSVKTRLGSPRTRTSSCGPRASWPSWAMRRSISTSAALRARWFPRARVLAFCVTSTSSRCFCAMCAIALRCPSRSKRAWV